MPKILKSELSFLTLSVVVERLSSSFISKNQIPRISIWIDLEIRWIWREQSGPSKLTCFCDHSAIFSGIILSVDFIGLLCKATDKRRHRLERVDWTGPWSFMHICVSCCTAFKAAGPPVATITMYCSKMDFAVDAYWKMINTCVS